MGQGVGRARARRWLGEAAAGCGRRLDEASQQAEKEVWQAEEGHVKEKLRGAGYGYGR